MNWASSSSSLTAPGGSPASAPGPVDPRRRLELLPPPALASSGTTTAALVSFWASCLGLGLSLGLNLSSVGIQLEGAEINSNQQSIAHHADVTHLQLTTPRLRVHLLQNLLQLLPLSEGFLEKRVDESVRHLLLGLPNGSIISVESGRGQHWY